MPNVAKRLVNGAMIILTLVGKISQASTNPCRNTPCKHKLVHVVYIPTRLRIRFILQYLTAKGVTVRTFQPCWLNTVASWQIKSLKSVKWLIRGSTCNTAGSLTVV